MITNIYKKAIKNKLLIILYLSAFIPLVLGTIVFYYWYYNLFYNGIDKRIEGKAFTIVLLYFLFSVITIITSIVILIKHRKLWGKIILPIICILITVPVIELYERIHITMSDIASFIKIENDLNGYEIHRIWSANFENDYFNPTKKEHIFYYFPVRNYDWTPIKFEYDGGIFVEYDYNISQLYIDLVKNEKDTMTFKLNELDKGQEVIVKLSNLIKNKTLE